MAIEGSLQDVSLADICQLLAMGRKTGCLTVTDRSNFGYVYFREGRVVYASVLNRPDRLGDLLVANDVISREDLSRAMRAQAEGGKGRLGEILVDQEALSRDELEKYIALQIREAVYHLFTWSTGAFHFDAGQAPDEGVFLIDIPAESLLLEGARRVDEWGLIERKIPSFDVVLAVVKDPSEADEGQDFELTDDQRRILPLIDGSRSLDDVVSESGMVEFDVGKAAYGLLQAGFIDKAGTRSADGGDVPVDERVEEHLNIGIAFYRSGMLEDATREFEAVLEIAPAHPRALFRLGLIQFRRGRPEGALEYFDRMPEEWRDSWAVLRNRALALELTYRYDDALRVLERALEVRPDDPDLALSRAIVQLEKGATEPALEELRRYRAHARVKRPSALYYAYAVLAAGMADRLEYAVQVGREGLQHYPDNGPILVNTGAVLEQRGELEAAMALYGRAVQAPHPPAQAHKNLGDHAYARGDLEQARMHYEKAVKIEPRLGDDVYVRLGAIAYRDQDVDVARLLWRRALELNPGNEAVRGQLELVDASI